MSEKNRHFPDVPPHWSVAIASFLEDRAAIGTGFLATFGLPKDFLSQPPDRIGVLKELELLETAGKLFGDELVGAKIGMAIDSRKTSLLSYVLINSGTLEDALRNAIRFARISRNRAVVARHNEAQGVFLQIDTSIASLQGNAQYFEFVLAAVTLSLRNAVGLQRVPLQVRFSHRRSGRLEQLLADIFQTDVRFGCDLPGLLFGGDDLSLPIVGADTQLLRHLTSLAEIVLAEKTHDPSSITTKAEKALSEQLQSGLATRDAIAAQLGITSRTLARQLRREGSSFAEILISLRRRLADRYLSDPALSLAEIAYLLGYSDQSTFCTAYKRWHGRSPGAARKDHDTGLGSSH